MSAGRRKMMISGLAVITVMLLALLMLSWTMGPLAPSLSYKSHPVPHNTPGHSGPQFHNVLVMDSLNSSVPRERTETLSIGTRTALPQRLESNVKDQVTTTKWTQGASARDPVTNMAKLTQGASVKERLTTAKWTQGASVKERLTTADWTQGASEANVSWTVSGQQQTGPGHTDTRDAAQHHVFFLKVHKAASTTVMNVIVRFSLRHRLYAMLPRHNNILSERSKSWRQNAIDLSAGVQHFDILCNHLVFDEHTIRGNLHPDTTFIGIVREPLSQFVSAFEYYRLKFHVPYLASIPGPDPLYTYLQYPQKWEPHNIGNSFTHNRMSFDFGMDGPGLTGNPLHSVQYIAYLNRTFHLVMISERFDESMVLLKRLLRWQLQDVLYIKTNVFKPRAALLPGAPPVHTLTPPEKEMHKAFNMADYILYEHFSNLFQMRVEAEGPSFAEEVAAFRALCEQMNRFCADSDTDTVTIAATQWSASFQASSRECELMNTDELQLIDIKRKEQERY